MDEKLEKNRTGQPAAMYEIDDIVPDEDVDEEGFPREDDDHASLSWLVEGSAAIKQADRAAFLFRETVLPPGVREFFFAADLEPGTKMRLVLWHGRDRYDAFIEKTIHATPLTRLIWRQDFSAVLWKEYPQWLEYFQKNRNDSAQTPQIQFTKRKEPGQYDVDLEGVLMQEAAGPFEVPLSPGDTIDNETLAAIFRCGPAGTVRRSPATGSLVIVADHTDPACEDTWIGKVFHFTGPDPAGEQNITSANRALAGSRESGTRLFLFEVFEKGKYVFNGEAVASDSPYRSRQHGRPEGSKDVMVFPLKLTGGSRPPVRRRELPVTGNQTTHAAVQEKNRPVVPATPSAAPELSRKPPAMTVPDPGLTVPEYAMWRANGTCQLCGKYAPFNTRDGKPYLELHHIVPLAAGGGDTRDNLVALCPNCHRRLHVLRLHADVEKLKKEVSPGK